MRVHYPLSHCLLLFWSTTVLCLHARSPFGTYLMSSLSVGVTDWQTVEHTTEIKLALGITILSTNIHAHEPKIFLSIMHSGYLMQRVTSGGQAEDLLK